MKIIRYITFKNIFLSVKIELVCHFKPNPMVEEKTHIVLLIGDDKVGKSTLVHKIKTNVYNNNYTPTHGLSVVTLNIARDDDTKLNIKFWDTGGDKVGLGDGYYNASAVIAVIMFDVTNKTSFDYVRQYHRDLRRVKPHIPIILMGNKTDEYDCKYNCVSICEATDLANELNMLYVPLSIKNEIDIKKLFRKAMKESVGFIE